MILDCVSTIKSEELGTLITELLARRPDVLMATPVAYVRALKQATTSIPIVMNFTPVPVEAGLVSSLARPEANITGLSFSGGEAAAKRVELLKELLPKLEKLALIVHKGADPAFNAVMENNVAIAATKWGFAWQTHAAGTAEDYDAIFAQLDEKGFGAAYIAPGPLAQANLTRIAGLGIRHRIATLGTFRSIRKKEFSSHTVKKMIQSVCVRLNMSINCFAAQSPVTCRLSNLLSLAWLLISRRPKR